MRKPDIIVPGRDNGDGMVIRYRTAAGTEIFGLGIPNIYAGIDWDLGPTWCYLILGRRKTLIDTGGYGKVAYLTDLLRSTGTKIKDINRIIITHSHEDHDGNLADILPVSKAELWAHAIFQGMVSFLPQVRAGARRPDLPGSCRMCPMPEKYQANCRPYHQKRSQLHIDRILDGDQPVTDDGFQFVFTPGHSPDSICIILENEVIFTGDTVLPRITPHPTLAAFFTANCGLLPPQYQQKGSVYGLIAHVRSLDTITRWTAGKSLACLTAHRLFYGGQFNLLPDCATRTREIIQFHIDRCRAILEIIGDSTPGIDDITQRHFTASQLKGPGLLMARDEIEAHLEVMEEAGDINRADGNGDLVRATGSSHYLDILGSYLPGPERSE
jgi:glyoxylase-like metal-dependent hydrolase (beta-lactamase superfamily II)